MVNLQDRQTKATCSLETEQSARPSVWIKTEHHFKKLNSYCHDDGNVTDAPLIDLIFQ